MNRFLVAAMLLFCLLWSGSATAHAAAYYDFVLASPVESSELTYSDEAINIKFFIPSRNVTAVHFQLYNKTSDPIKLIWDFASFISPIQETLRISRERVPYAGDIGIKHIDPTIVLPNTNKNDHIKVSYIIHAASLHSFKPYWNQETLFPDIYDEATLYNNATFGVVLPIEIKGEIKYYNFTFRITNVKKESK